MISWVQVSNIQIQMLKVCTQGTIHKRSLPLTLQIRKHQVTNQLQTKWSSNSEAIRYLHQDRNHQIWRKLGKVHRVKTKVLRL